MLVKVFDLNASTDLFVKMHRYAHLECAEDIVSDDFISEIFFVNIDIDEDSNYVCPFCGENIDQDIEEEEDE
jgi:hypothetical protein